VPLNIIWFDLADEFDENTSKFTVKSPDFYWITVSSGVRSQADVSVKIVGAVPSVRLIRLSTAQVYQYAPVVDVISRDILANL